MTWDIVNYEENVKFINSKLDNLFVHIKDDLKRLNDLTKEQNNFEAVVVKEAGDSSRDPWFQLYQSSKTIRAILYRIISNLAIQIDVLNNTIYNLQGLLLDAKRYGILKQKVETELQILGEIKNHLITTMDTMRKSYFESLAESDKRVNNILTLLSQVIIESKKGEKVDISSLQSEINELKQKLEEKEKIPREEKEIPERTVTPVLEETPKRVKIFNSIIKLVRDEGITDKFEIAERLGLTPGQVAAYGFKRILEKYGRVSEKEKEEETKEEEEISEEEKEISEEEEKEINEESEEEEE